MEEEDREMEGRDGEGRGGNKMEKRKPLYRDPWVAVELLVKLLVTVEIKQQDSQWNYW